MPDQDTIILDDFGPLPVVQPQSVAELGDLVRRAAAEGSAIYPLGGRTMLNLGMPPTRPGLGVDMRRLDQVIDYPARDMTITMQAGITIAKLQALLAKEKQQLPIDVPFADRATLGGAIATNTSGPRRYGYGTLRDYVIGISVINDEGQETKAGGRVVKNVAGYDLCKLHVGALGTLGIITQVTLKLRPLPEHSAWVELPCHNDLPGMLNRLHATRTRPVAVTVVSVAKNAWLVVVAYEGSVETIGWQSKQLQHELGHTKIGFDQHCSGAVGQATWTTLANFPLSEPASVTFRADMLPSATASFCEMLTQWEGRLVFNAHAGSGIVIAHCDPTMAREEVSALLRPLVDSANANHGNLVLLRCPPAWKKYLPVWGTPRPDNWLMRTIKDKLDPKALFNPGRFVAGI